MRKISMIAMAVLMFMDSIPQNEKAVFFGDSKHRCTRGTNKIK